MKTSEFIKRVEELGYEVVEGWDSVRVFRDNSSVATVHGIRVNSLDTYWEKDVPHELFHVLFSYASTPIEERKEDKKYYLYHPVLNNYFNYNKIDEYYIWSDVFQTTNVQVMFTEEEIENNKFRDIMKLLEKVEVE